MWQPLRKVVFLMLVVGLAWVGHRFVISPAQQSLGESQDRLKLNRMKLSEFEKTTNTALDLTRQLEQLRDAITFFEQKLPPTSEIYSVLEQITLIAQKQGLKPKIIRTLGQKQNSGYVEQPLEMKFEGSFTAFYSFLLEIEKMPRIMKVRKLDVNKTRQLEGRISADCIVSIFFQNV
ncbi:MAG: type 4a pilus biogenesis protein PilO [Phycisphaeraceae bacterium]|nr:type 4a pilus biogenesis protein PilO [Phycisphaeraceae bacterium]